MRSATGSGVEARDPSAFSPPTWLAQACGPRLGSLFKRVVADAPLPTRLALAIGTQIIPPPYGDSWSHMRSPQPRGHYRHCNGSSCHRELMDFLLRSSHG